MRHFLFAALSLVLAITGFSQPIDSLLEWQRQTTPQEKLYVQFDKNYYNPGETIWFKAYLLNGFEPSEISKTLYAEFMDETGNVIGRRTAPIAFSGATSSFQLDSGFAKPAVFFRAYTASLLLGDTAFLFTKAIRILSTKAAAPKATPAVTPTIRFLPEGGDWVAGLPSVVAFIATDSRGLPVPVTGVVTDNTGTKVANLVTLHDGMGQFNLRPQAGSSYTATWKDATGRQYTTPLPSIKPDGLVLALTNDGLDKRFTVFRTATAQNIDKVLVVGIMNQRVVFKANINLENRVNASGVFPTANLPSGILQVTVFDNLNTPLAERIIFVNNRDYEFDGDAFLSQKAFGKRALNEIEISVSDTIPSNLSLSITDAALNEASPMQDNIISRLLLTADLRGIINKPYYYFFSTSDSAALHLDLVMLTHGWRRYNWEQLRARKAPAPPYVENNYLNLSGQVMGLKAGTFGSDLQLTGILQTVDSARNFLVMPLDRTGRVATDGFIFYDNAKLYFNFNKKSLSFDKSMLSLDNGLVRGYNRIVVDSIVRKSLPDINANTVAANQKITRTSLQAQRLMAQSRVLENITISTRVKTAKDKMEERYVSGLFSGSSAATFDLVNDPVASSYLDIFQYLQGRVAGLQISTGGGQPSLSWRGGTPAVYLNEMPTDVSMLQSTPVADIAYVKVFRPGESIAMGGGGGIISIYTRRGGDSQPSTASKGLNYVQVAGYSSIKEFYSPNYATANERDAYDDVRSTLYWNPFIITDKNRRRIRIKFYNNDISKRFRLVLEGINADGRLIHVEKEVGE